MNSEQRHQVETIDDVRLELAGYVEVQPDWIGRRHAHPFWEMVLLFSGAGVYDIDGGDPFPVAGVQTILIRPGVRHQYRNNADGIAKMLYLGFSCSADEKEAKAPPIRALDPGYSRLLTTAAELAASPPDTRRERLNHFRALFFHAISDLAVNLLHLRPDAPVSTDERHAMLIAKVKDYLSKHLDLPIDVNALGEAFYFSPHYLSDLFKQHTGMSPRQFHHGLRMREADRLMHELDLSVTDTAERLGFNSVQHFSRRYHNFFGHTPSQRGR